jgi:hypothetical protein
MKKEKKRMDSHFHGNDKRERMGMTEGRGWFTLTLTLSPQGRGGKDGFPLSRE